MSEWEWDDERDGINAKIDSGNAGLRIILDEYGLSLKNLEVAVQSLSSDLSAANQLIAYNMFAVVRLELSAASDNIAALAINEKNRQTGKGKAALVMNIAATAGILAGTALSGGGMAALGGLIVASANVAKAGANSNERGSGMSFVGTLMQVVVAGSNTGTIARDATKLCAVDAAVVLQTQGHSENNTTTVSDATVAAHVAEVVGCYRKHMMNTAADVDDITYVPGVFPAFKVQYSNTMFKEHGSGGESAIQYDVQRCLHIAYGVAIKDISEALKSKSTSASDGGFASMSTKNDVI